MKEQFNQSPTIEACNSNIINLVTQMEQLKMTLKQADDEFNSLEQQQVSGESIETLENVKALESKIKQTELENIELANSMTKMQMKKPWLKVAKLLRTYLHLRFHPMEGEFHRLTNNVAVDLNNLVFAVLCSY